jgi:protein-S-isoprenylcysteine O-methyltransferase Ste14
MTDHYLELKVPPPAVLLVASLLMLALTTVLAALNFPFPEKNLLAAVVAVLGALMCIAGVVEFRRVKTTVNPMRPVTTTALVTRGVYRMSRNPMYLGFLLLLAALAIYLANAAAFLALPLFVFYMNRFQIAPEERALRALFGEAFTSYMTRTRRWI